MNLIEEKLRLCFIDASMVLLTHLNSRTSCSSNQRARRGCDSETDWVDFKGAQSFKIFCYCGQITL